MSKFRMEEGIEIKNLFGSVMGKGFWVCVVFNMFIVVVLERDSRREKRVNLSYWFFCIFLLFFLVFVVKRRIEMLFEEFI